jgi:hypothetical protein
MACVSAMGMLVPSNALLNPRALTSTRAKLGDARVPSALAAFSGLALRQPDRWLDQKRRCGLALRDNRRSRRCATAPSDARIPSEDLAARKDYVPRSKNPEVRGAAVWISLGVPLVCSECETTETSRWLGNKDRPEKPICNVCYFRQLAARRGTCDCCGKEGTHASAMRRSKLKKDAWLCTPCSHREAPADRTCGACGASVNDDSSAWLRSKLEDDAWLCTRCYHRQLVTIAKAAGTTCGDCGTDTTPSWYNSKLKPGAKVCQSCYLRLKLAEAKAVGTTCGECGTDTTSQWRNSKRFPGTKVCQSCYKKNWLKKKKKKGEVSLDANGELS